MLKILPKQQASTGNSPSEGGTPESFRSHVPTDDTSIFQDHDSSNLHTNDTSHMNKENTIQETENEFHTTGNNTDTNSHLGVSHTSSNAQTPTKGTVKKWEGDQATEGGKDSITVLLEWMVVYYDRYQAEDRNKGGKSKEYYHKEILNAMIKENIHHRTTKSIKAKISDLVKTFRHAVEWKSRAGNALTQTSDGVQLMSDHIKKLCPFFDQLYPILYDKVFPLYATPRKSSNGPGDILSTRSDTPRSLSDMRMSDIEHHDHDEIDELGNDLILNSKMNSDMLNMLQQQNMQTPTDSNSIPHHERRVNVGETPDPNPVLHINGHGQQEENVNASMHAFTTDLTNLYPRKRPFSLLSQQDQVDGSVSPASPASRSKSNLPTTPKGRLKKGPVAHHSSVEKYMEMEDNATEKIIALVQRKAKEEASLREKELSSMKEAKEMEIQAMLKVKEMEIEAKKFEVESHKAVQLQQMKTEVAKAKTEVFLALLKSGMDPAEAQAMVKRMYDP